MALARISQDCVMEEGRPFTNVVEVARMTGLSPQTIFGLIRSDGIVLQNNKQALEPVLMAQDGQILDNYQSGLIGKRVQPSKERDKITSRIESEGQRYQRRFQFPRERRSVRTTSQKAERRCIGYQVQRTRIGLLPITKVDSAETERFEPGDTMYFSKGAREDAQRAALLAVDTLGNKSVAPLERPGRIKELVYNAVLKGTPVTLINWICPPGSPLSYDANSNSLYRRFNQIDNQKGFEADYRLYPRLSLEQTLVRTFQRTKAPFDYIKFVADDNPFCLYQAGLERDGEVATLSNIEGYTDYVQNQLDQLINPQSIFVTRWSDFMGSQMFKEFLYLYNSTSINDLRPYLPEDVIETELDVIEKHTNLDPALKTYLEPFVQKVIRQYAVEGYFLYRLFGDTVVLAWNESTNRTAIIDSLRKARGIPPLPKIFVLHEKREGIIKDNF